MPKYNEYQPTDTNNMIEYYAEHNLMQDIQQKKVTSELNDDLIDTSVRDWQRSGYLIVDNENHNCFYIKNRFFESQKEGFNAQLLNTYQQPPVEKREDLEKLIQDLAKKVGGDSSNNNSLYCFLMNYAHQGGFINGATFPLWQTIGSLNNLNSSHKYSDGIYLSDGGNLTLLVGHENSNYLEIVCLQKISVGTTNSDEQLPPLHYSTTFKLSLEPNHDTENQQQEIRLSVQNIELFIPEEFEKKFPLHAKKILANIQPLKGLKKFIIEKARKRNKGESIKFYHQEEFEAIKSPLKELLKLKELLAEKMNKTTDKDSQYYHDVKKKSEAIDELCNSVADQIFDHFNSKDPYSQDKLTKFYQNLALQVEKTLNKDEIKRNDGSLLSRFVKTTLRSIASFFIALTLVPLAVPYVRHSLFRNKESRILNRSLHKIENMPKKLK